MPKIKPPKRSNERLVRDRGRCGRCSSTAQTPRENREKGGICLRARVERLTTCSMIHQRDILVNGLLGPFQRIDEAEVIGGYDSVIVTNCKCYLARRMEILRII